MYPVNGIALMLGASFVWIANVKAGCSFSVFDKGLTDIKAVGE